MGFSPFARVALHKDIAFGGAVHKHEIPDVLGDATTGARGQNELLLSLWSRSGGAGF